jgi:nicotinamide riboside transporter PnuC
MTLGWIGNMFIVLAMLCLGRKWTVGWVFSVLGNIVWCWYAITLNMYDILAVDVFCTIMAAYNWWTWKKGT